MKDIYVNHIAQQMQGKAWQVENCALMFEQGDTIPFISRYRKERTGGLDDASVAEIKHWVDLYQDMEKRKSTILDTIASQDKLTDELKSAIENCVIPAQLEDLYLPYRPKRRTRATAAKEAGLEPLADVMYAVRTRNPQAEAQKYVGDKVPGVEEALAGARDIIAERLSETASVRETLRGIFRARRIVAKATKAAQDNPEAAKYRSYFNFSMPIQRIPAHNLLAILRAQGEGFLSVDIDADAEKCSKKLYYDFCQEHSYPAEPLAEQIRMAVEDSFKRLLEPSISNEIIKEAKEKADIESIKVFGENLTQLLLSAPLGQKRTMAVDPGFRNGCKIACLDEYGSLLIFDEVISGFRAALGGAQERFGIRADLCTYGKIIGGGFPVGCGAGRAELMEQLAPTGPVYQAGTLSGNPVAMEAGIATLKKLSRPGVYEELERKGALLAEVLRDAVAASGVAACVNQVGSLATLFFNPGPVTCWNDAAACDTEAFARYFRQMLDAGFLIAPSQFEALFIGLSHTDAEIERFGAAAKAALQTL